MCRLFDLSTRRRWWRGEYLTGPARSFRHGDWEGAEKRGLDCAVTGRQVGRDLARRGGKGDRGW